ncbi:MAG TPA: response regulator [Nevskiaceae bacterium]
MARVMVVDDSPTDTEHIKTILMRGGYDVISADSGRRAINLARSEAPDCVVMDIVMPGMNGFQATRALRRDPATTHIPIVVVSSKNQATDRLWAMRQGARQYIVKPVEEPELLNTVRQLLAA